MTNRDDHAYYVARASKEASIAETCSNQRVAAIHFEMAFRYAVLAHGPPIQVVVENINFLSGTGGLPLESNAREGERAFH